MPYPWSWVHAQLSFGCLFADGRGAWIEFGFLGGRGVGDWVVGVGFWEGRKDTSTVVTS